MIPAAFRSYVNYQGTLAAAEAAGVLLHLGVKYYSLPLCYRRLDLSNRPTINRLQMIEGIIMICSVTNPRIQIL